MGLQVCDLLLEKIVQILRRNRNLQAIISKRPTSFILKTVKLTSREEEFKCHQSYSPEKNPTKTFSFWFKNEISQNNHFKLREYNILALFCKARAEFFCSLEYSSAEKNGIKTANKCGVVVITSALHAEGRGFNPHHL